MRILLVDNYDSFTYNLVHQIKELGYVNIEVIKNDKIDLEDIEKYDKIIISPGPGIPKESGSLLLLLVRYANTKSILGICLGEQAIGEIFGGKLINLQEVHHGISSTIKIVNNNYLFGGMENEIEAGRYHSWIVSRENLPECLIVTAEDEEGQIMGIRHKEYDVHGIQFHPESVLTPQGNRIIKNFLEN